MLESVEKFSLELGGSLEFHFETLEPEQPMEAVRKCSFVDLLSTPQGIPEVPNFEALLEKEDTLSVSDSLSTHTDSEVSLVSLMEFMPVQGKPRIRKRPKPLRHSRIPERPPNTMVGTCNLEERREKIQKYLEKRKRRTWNKRISYECRKKVADSRLRIKGRFVTKDQAIAILGIDHPAVQKLLNQQPDSA